MDRVFLDENVLFSAAYLERSGLARLWKLRDANLLSSAYAIEEARRNLAIQRPDALIRLKHLVQALSIVNPPHGLALADSVRLAAKDRPVLLAAIHASADYLLTGDAHHFERFYGSRIGGVVVLRPAQYLTRKPV